MKDDRHAALVAKFNLWNPVHFVALGFGSGLLKPAPGTWGTLAGVPIYIWLSSFSLVTYLLVTAFAFLIGIWLCDITCRDAGVHDHGAIVWDEIVGLLITMAAVPYSWSSLVLGFLLFRLFDILKPWPISVIDNHVKGGLGIMFDDVVAAFFSLAIIQTVIYFL